MAKQLNALITLGSDSSYRGLLAAIDPQNGEVVVVEVGVTSEALRELADGFDRLAEELDTLNKAV